ncbi:MAG: hypothetical protein COV46_00825 [Deltaproteobacteria bacterium CG11_big_fil_rev_8_21_14_0_20_49_13]|nr:MAG: hypothetical protein COV46_00825 [Deltaproteobacteria bacterium CG11_big_fil_rev_8_21_14_0_20_49_13]
MKKLAVVCLVLGLSVGLSQTSHAWLFSASASSNYKQSSDNKYSSDNDNSIHDSAVIFDTGVKQLNSNNKYDSRSYKYDDSIKESFNTDNRAFDSSDNSDRSIKDSYNTNFTGNTFEDSVGKRIASHDIGGSVSNSVLGNFDQKVGSDFSGGFSGNPSSIEASVTNTQTFGNVNVGASSEK